MNKPISSIDLVEPDDAPTDMAVNRKIPKWARQILQNTKEHENPHGVDGSIEKYKARFVARGFSQKEGVNYDETFFPMARDTSIRWMSRKPFSMTLSIHYFLRLEVW